MTGAEPHGGETRERQEALARSERYFRALIERCSELITVLDADGTITYATPAYTQMLGYLPEEVIGRQGLTLVAPDDLAMVSRVLAGLLAQPGGTATAEYRVLHKDGSTCTVHSIGHNLLDDPAVRGVVVNSYDVTERRAVEQTLRKQAELLGLMFDRIPALVTLYTEDGTTLYSNDEWERVTGWTRSERGDDGFVDRLAPDPGVAAALSDFMCTAAPGEWRDFPLRMKNGDTCEVAWTLLRLSNGSTLAFGRDVTEERRLGAQLRQAQKMEAIGRLTAGIAHDFNNLLQIITGNAFFAREAVRNERPVLDEIAQIESAAEHAAGLTRQLLAFSRQQVLTPQPLDLARVIEAMENMLRRMLGDDMVIVTTLGEGAIVEADRNQLEQVVMNLAVNARDAMPHGGTLTLCVERRRVTAPDPDRRPGLPPGEYAALEVVDTGMGMTATTLAHMFEPFYTTKDPGHGTGLGLATVYGIVKQSGGFVYADSTLGDGSRFEVLLPLIASDGDSPARVGDGRR